MKSSPDHFPGDEKTDALLFDYLEGELSEAEVKKLEEQLATDPALRCELDYWREAYVQDRPYYPVQLENNLLKGPGPGAFFAAVKIAVLTAIFSVWPLSLEKKNSVWSPSPPTWRIESRLVKQPPEKETTSITVQPQAVPALIKRNRKTISIREEIALPHPVREEEFLRPTMDSQAVRIPAPVILPLPQLNRSVSPANPASQVITRKQQREITRKKEKARREREANQFLRGNVPYVVPLQSNDF